MAPDPARRRRSRRRPVPPAGPPTGRWPAPAGRTRPPGYVTATDCRPRTHAAARPRAPAPACWPPGGVENADTGQQDEDQYQLHRPRHLIEHLADPRQDRLDIEQRHGGKIPHQIAQQLALAAIEMKRRDVTVAEVLQYARREDDVEVGSETVPIQVSQTGDAPLQRFAADRERHGIAERQPQALGQPALQRDRCDRVGGNGSQPAFCR